MALPINQHRVLVLNKLWVAVNTYNLHDAMCKLFSTYRNGESKAKIIDPSADFATYTWADWEKMRPKEGENVIRTPSKAFRIPEVILLARYDKMPHHRANFSRRAIHKRDNYLCQYCGDRPGTFELTIDHIVPRAQGGLTTWDNCVSACVTCNSQKANRHPEKACRAKGQKDWRLDAKPDDPVGWKGPSPMKLRKMPVKPKFSLFKAKRAVAPKSWTSFLSEVYWSCELVNDEEEE